MQIGSKIYGGGGGGVKSVQRGKVSIPTSANFVTVTITAVDTTKTMCNFLGVSCVADVNALTRMSLTNSTTLTFTRSNSSGASGTISWEVMEYS